MEAIWNTKRIFVVLMPQDMEAVPLSRLGRHKLKRCCRSVPAVIVVFVVKSTNAAPRILNLGKRSCIICAAPYLVERSHRIKDSVRQEQRRADIGWPHVIAPLPFKEQQLGEPLIKCVGAEGLRVRAIGPNQSGRWGKCFLQRLLLCTHRMKADNMRPICIVNFALE